VKIQVRKVTDDDHAFIYATYLRNRWFDRNNTTTLKRTTWSALQHKRLERLLKDSMVLIACISDDPTAILGYIFVDEGGSDYCYIKLAFRSEGFGIEKILKGALHG
jgi:hypothetical protein